MLCISQEGLKKIKLQHGDRICLRKSNAPSTAPFPVHVSIYNETDHPGLEHYDQLESLKVTTTISNLALQDCVQNLQDVICLKVVAPELPASLTQKMQDTLVHMFNGQHPTESPTVETVLSTISNLAANLATFLPELLTLVPKCMEHYESIGPSGDSQRRIKFNDTKTVAKCCASADVHTEDTSQHQVEHRVCTSSAPDARTDASIPIVIARALKQLGTRFPDLKMSSATSHLPGTTSSPVTFMVSILPSDPNWEHGELSMSGSVALIDIHRTNPPMRGSPQQPFAGNTTLQSYYNSAHAAPVCELRQARKAVTAPQAGGPGTAAVLKLEPGELTDAAACAIVNQMLRRQSQVHAGMHDTFETNIPPVLLCVLNASVTMCVQVKQMVCVCC